MSLSIRRSTLFEQLSLARPMTPDPSKSGQRLRSLCATNACYEHIADETCGAPIYKTAEELSHLFVEMKTADVVQMGTDPQPQSPMAKRVYKLVLTGGPCGGKTTGQERLATFFEQLGWKVFTVPEAATVLLGGGVKFQELTQEQAYEFQKDLLKTLIRIEEVYFNQGLLIKDKNVLIICDRGAMDPSAYMDPESWQKVLNECGLDQFSLREDRYNQVIHLVTAADGADQFYTLANNATRKEGIEQAKKQDEITRQAWIGHPYVDIIDNSNCQSFDDKILKLLEVVCDRIGLPVHDRLHKNSKKRKWLVRAVDCTGFPKYEEFKVTHNYLKSDNADIQVRIRSRTQNNRTTYTITSRHFLHDETVETRMKISDREYQRYLTMRDRSRATIHKLRKCFSFGNVYFNLDTYVEPLPPNARGPTIILETYTTSSGDSFALPPFLEVVKEITGDSNYSMYQIARCPGTKLDLFSGSPESAVFSDD